jgi:hypothetical protein
MVGFRANPNLGVTFVRVVFISGGANLYENGCNFQSNSDLVPKYFGQ